ncbi:MAG: DUF86 domain-containing protein [Deltaproteobacteria bacterium]|nr:DUF86 domain-containing protein [Deltaproteobacteria bacterium]
MVNADLVAAKLAELATRLAQVRRHVPGTAAELAASNDALDLVSFNLMLAVQVCADVSSHVIADEGWTLARSLAEGFDRLAEHGVIEPDVAASLRKAVKVRNIVAHGYAGIDAEHLYAGATAGLGPIEAFAAQVSAWIAKRAAPG